MKLTRRGLIKGLLGLPLLAVVGLPKTEPDYGPLKLMWGDVEMKASRVKAGKGRVHVQRFKTVTSSADPRTMHVVNVGWVVDDLEGGLQHG